MGGSSVLRRSEKCILGVEVSVFARSTGVFIANPMWIVSKPMERHASYLGVAVVSWRPRPQAQACRVRRRSPLSGDRRAPRSDVCCRANLLSYVRERMRVSGSSEGCSPELGVLPLFVVSEFEEYLGRGRLEAG